MRRVCIVVPKYHPGQPIVNRSVSALLAEGYQVDVICMRRPGQKEYEIVEGVHVYRLPVTHRRESLPRYFAEYVAFFVMATAKLSWLSIKRRYDVVQVCTIPDFLAFTTVPAKLFGTKVVLYMFDYMPELFATTFNKGEGNIVVRILRFVEKISSRYADRVIVVCENQKRRVQSNDGISDGKLSVVLNVPDEAVFAPAAAADASDQEHFRLITHGTILQRQGIQTLIRAIPRLLPDIPNLLVDVLGDGEYRPELERLVCELNVAPFVNFIDPVPLGEVPAHIGRAHAGVVAHLHDLMLPHKVFEYLAMNKPVIASDHRHMRDYFDEDTILFYRPGDEANLAQAVLELYRNPAKRASLAVHSRETYQRFRWQVTKSAYLKVFEELTAKK